MEENQTYDFILGLSNFDDNVISQIDDQRNKIPQGDNVDVTFTLYIHNTWHPSNDETNAVLDLMEKFKCTVIKLFHCSDEIDPGVKKILTAAIMNWNSLELQGGDAELVLYGEFSDAAFKSIHELIIANGGIKELSLEDLTLSNESWELFNSHKLGTEDEHSTISFSDPKMSDEIFAQVLNHLENPLGFKTWSIDIGNSRFPEAFRTLGQVLSRPDCEVFDLHITRGSCNIEQMLETLTTNTSVTALYFSDWTDNDLTCIMKEIHKFIQLTIIGIFELSESSSLEFLRPLLDNASSELMNPSLEALCLGEKRELSEVEKRELSEVENDLLLQVARCYKKLGSFGPKILLNPDGNHILCMNSQWRQFMTREPELPLSLWRFVLEDVEKDPDPHWSSNEEQKEEDKATLVASIRYELVQHIVCHHISNFIRPQKRKS